MLRSTWNNLWGCVFVNALIFPHLLTLWRSLVAVVFLSIYPFCRPTISLVFLFLCPLKHSFSCFLSSPLLTKCLFLPPSRHDLPAVFSFWFFSFTDTRELLGEMDGIDVLLQQLSVRFLLFFFPLLFLVSSVHYPSYFPNSPLRGIHRWSFSISLIWASPDPW